MNTKNILSFFGLLLVLALVTMGVVKIWMPDAISDDSFVKMVVTFGLLTIGALAASFLSRGTNTAENESDKE